MEKKISVAERNAARLRLEYQEADSDRVRFADEVWHNRQLLELSYKPWYSFKFCSNINQNIFIVELYNLAFNICKVLVELIRKHFMTESIFVQLDALKRTVDRTNQDLEITRTQVSQLKKDIMDKQGKLREMVEIRESLNDKLKMATEAQLSAEELAARMDEMMEAEERRQKVWLEMSGFY